MFSIHNSKVVLRDIDEDDIAAIISWEAKDLGPLDYRFWDAPWEYEGLTDEEKLVELGNYEAKLQKRRERSLSLSDSDMRSRLIIAPKEAPESFIGSCSFYCIDEEGDYTDEDTDLITVGIDIPDPGLRGHGYGFAALKLYIDYLRTLGAKRIFTQTWSGNTNMLKLARKLGFRETICKNDVRTVRGEIYDGLTFELDEAAFAAITEPAEELPLKKLDELGIDYIRVTHPAASTMELCRGIGEEYGARHCKNLFLSNRSGTDFHLLLMHPDKPFRTSVFSKLIGVSRLSFGSDEKLQSVMGLAPGSVSVLGLVNESALAAVKEGRLHIEIDSDLMKNERICVHPNTNTATLIMRTEDVVRLLDSLGVPFRTVDIPRIASEDQIVLEVAKEM